jgi:hypothetical protein
MPTQPSLPGTPSRRVLGDLPPQAMNTPSKAKNMESSELTRAQSPLKPLQATPRAFANKENATSIDAFSHGRKRSIADVDDAESVPAAKMVAFERDTPQEQEDAITQLTAAAVQRHTVHLPQTIRPPSTNSTVQQPFSPRRPGVPYRSSNSHAFASLTCTTFTYAAVERTPAAVERTTVTASPRLAKVLLRVPRLRPLRVPAK